MLLKYRLIIVAIAVFALTFGAGGSATTAEAVTVVLLARASATREPASTILHRDLINLCVTTALLLAGMCLVGMGLVGRVRRLNRAIDATMPEGPAGAKRSGDEPARVAAALHMHRTELRTKLRAYGLRGSRPS